MHSSGRHPGKSRYVGRAAIAADCNPVSLRFESGTYLHFNPAPLDLFRAEFRKVTSSNTLPELNLLVSFTVRTKEPADVFPRRARLGRLRIITCFA